MILSPTDLLTEVMSAEAATAARLGELNLHDADDVQAFWTERRFGMGAIRAFGARALERAHALLTEDRVSIRLVQS